MINMFLLASKSPRRKEMMNQISSSFLTFSPDIDESVSLDLKDPIKIVKDISLRKAKKAKEEYKDLVIIAADTIVVFDNKIYGKPKDEEDAKKILRELSGNTHEVITAYTLIKDEKIITNTVTSKVIFNDLSDELINGYVKSGSPLDKAGAYGIQDNDIFPIIKSYVGSYDNIKGFPVTEIQLDINKLLKNSYN